jgi:hypothetical protein
LGYCLGQRYTLLCKIQPIRETRGTGKSTKKEKERKRKEEEEEEAQKECWTASYYTLVTTPLQFAIHITK